MATFTTRVESIWQVGAAQFTHHHSIPRSLVLEAGRAGRDAEYDQRFVQAMIPLMREHAPACRMAAGPSCECSGRVSTDVLQSPMSMLHGAPPRVVVWVTALCGGEQCETEAMQETQLLMQEMRQDKDIGYGTTGSSVCVEVKICKVCGTTVGVKRCNGCHAVAYCGKEHQKEDWKVHKRACVPRERQQTRSF